MRLRQQLVTTLALGYEQALLEEKNDMPILNVLDEADVPFEKSGPSRTLNVLIAILAAAGVTWLWSFILGESARFHPGTNPETGQTA